MSDHDIRDSMTNPYRCPPEPIAESGGEEPVEMSSGEPVASDRRWIKFGLSSVASFVAYLALPVVFSDGHWRDLLGLGLFSGGMVFAAMTAIAQVEHDERFGNRDR